MTRIVIFTGKGGVGKTSVAASCALHSAKEEKNTLLISTDMAHSLSDLFQIPSGRDCINVLPYLDLLELDPHHIMEEEFQDIQNAILEIFSALDVSKDADAGIHAFPGMNELICLLKILDICEWDHYERLIIDCAPTGETLSLLKFPELLSWYMEKFFPVGKIAMRVLSPVSKKLFKIALPNKNAMNDIQRMYLKLLQLQELLKDGSTTSIRLVAIPEKMVVEETKRNYMYMNMYNFKVDGLYINRILPENMDNSYFENWLEIQGRYIQELESTFHSIPITKIPWFDSDVVGLDGIAQLEKQALSQKDVFQILNLPAAERYEKAGEAYHLFLSLPNVSKDEINLHQSGSDLIVKIGNFKRNIPLPQLLKNWVVEGAKLEQDVLKIVFLPKKEGI